MKKTFRWSCVILSVFTFCAWALLLREAKQPWKPIGVKGTSNYLAEANLNEKEIEKNAVLAAKTEPASPREGDRMLDSIVLQQEQQQESPEIHGRAAMLFMGPGPVAGKSRHHRAKKSSETDADSSSEKTEKTDDVVLASVDNAEESKLVQTLIPSTPLPSTSSLVLMPTVGLSAPSIVNNATQTLVERITSPVGTTVNDVTGGITGAPRTRLQSLVYTTQSTIPNTSTVGTIVGNTTTTLQAPVQTLTSQTLGTVSSVTGSISSVSSSTPISGSPISPMVITPSSTSSSAVAAPASSLVVSQRPRRASRFLQRPP